MGISAKDMSDASGLEFTELGNEFNEIMGLMSIDADEFRAETEEAIQKAQDAFKDYEDVIHSVAESTGTDLDSLNGVLETVADNNIKIADQAKLATDAMWDQIGIVHQLSISYAELAKQVMEAIRQLEALANQAADSKVENNVSLKDVDFAKQAYDLVVNKGYSITEAQAIIEPARAKKIEELGMNPSQYGTMGEDFWNMLLDIGLNNNADEYVEKGMLDASYADMSETDKKYASNFADATTSGKTTAKLIQQGLQPSYDYVKSLGIKVTLEKWKAVYEQGIEAALEWLWKQEEKLGLNKTSEDYFFGGSKNPEGFATGGYTGEFDNAKLAFLHEKELVLNQQDTENILSAVNAIREIPLDTYLKGLEALDRAVYNLLNEKLNISSKFSANRDALQQEVNINANFPGVTSAREIEEALNNIINDAAQFASTFNITNDPSEFFV